jgi:malonate decarboxylase beta subunit
MSLAAGVSSYVVMTSEARLGLNGPQVIEEESGVEEFDASDRTLLWAITGGVQRSDQGLVDVLVDDDAELIGKTIRELIAKGVPPVHRSERVKLYRARIAALDTSRQWNPKELDSWATQKKEK